MTEKKFKKALYEASTWELKLTKFERTELTYVEARLITINRIFEKYKKFLDNK